jgi:hypothetical protein
MIGVETIDQAHDLKKEMIGVETIDQAHDLKKEMIGVETTRDHQTKEAIRLSNLKENLIIKKKPLKQAIPPIKRKILEINFILQIP